jgi:hypothetical protein
VANVVRHAGTDGVDLTCSTIASASKLRIADGEVTMPSVDPRAEVGRGLRLVDDERRWGVEQQPGQKWWAEWRRESPALPA